MGGVLLALVLLFVGCVFLLDLIVPHISFETEQKLFHAFVGDGVMVPGDRQPVRERAIRELLETVPDGCGKPGYPVVVEVVDNTRVNAFALPGGRIVIMSGLLDTLKSENELMFVLGHEMGHMVNRDHLEGFLRAALMAGLMHSVEWATGIELASDPLNLTVLVFSREAESKADRHGLDFINCVYGHVSGADQFFQTMAKDHESPGWAVYLSTHPNFQQRIGRLDAYKAEMGYGAGELTPLNRVLK